jgi:hypothetical protein
VYRFETSIPHLYTVFIYLASKMSLFGKKKTPEQIMKEQQRDLARTDRSLQRDRQKLEAQEKQIVCHLTLSTM